MFYFYRSVQIITFFIMAISISVRMYMKVLNMPIDTKLDDIIVFEIAISALFGVLALEEKVYKE